jgi:hypothetical protein
MSETKQSAQAKAAAAIYRGVLVRGPCSQCGAPKTDAHHEDYSKPLDVVWLCRKCHRLRHAELDRQNGRRGHAEDRTTLNLPAEIARAIDNYWHSEQLRSRNEAIRELLAYALDHKLTAKPAKESRR